MGLEEQQQPLPPEQYTTTKEKSLVETVAVQALDNRCSQQEQRATTAEEGVVVRPHIVSSPTPSVRSNTNNNNDLIQCCYKVSARCQRAIIMENINSSVAHTKYIHMSA